MLRTLSHRPAPALARTAPDRCGSRQAADEPLAKTWRHVFVADWMNAVFIHFAIDPAVLQPFVPFALDLNDGLAYVSLVAFTQRRIRPRWGGRAAAALSGPLATHPFLNVRTYVRHGDD